MSERTLEQYFAEIEKQEKLHNVKIEINKNDIIDKDHLNCLWYGGEIGRIVYPDGWALAIGVYGDVRVNGIVDGSEVECKDKCNGGSAYWDIARATENGVDDERLQKLCDAFYDTIAEADDPDNIEWEKIDHLDFEDNNWVEVDAIAPNGEWVDLCDCDNVLDDNILDPFLDIDGLEGYLACAKAYNDPNDEEVP